MIQILAKYCLLEKGKRANLEDFVYPNCNINSAYNKVFIVCDGVGGESKGEIASKIAAETFAACLSDPAMPSVEVGLDQALSQTQLKFQEYIDESPEASNMSTTLTVAVFQHGNLAVAWCGDSRIYHIRGHKVIWKSKDHSLVQQLIDMGEILEQEAKTHPKRNVILRSLSLNTKLENIDCKLINDIRSDDYILLASDGLFEQIDDEVLVQVLSDQNPDKAKLIYEKCKDKTNDNFSMYLLKLGVMQKIRPWKWFLLALLLLMFLSVFYFLITKSNV